MNKSNGPIACTKDTSKLVRARFGPGMLLQHEDLEQLNNYTRDLSRLMFKSLFGCGVICGLRVTPSLDCGQVRITVQAGVALACSGDPIHVPNDKYFPLDEKCDPNIPSPLYVVLCRTVKCCAPRTAICSDEDEGHSECTREIDGFEICVERNWPECDCGCPLDDDDEDQVKPDSFCKCVNPELACYKDHYDGTCGCKCGECSDCDGNCVVLARLYLEQKKGDNVPTWYADHRVRRFIRPVLIRDPVVAIEEAARRQQKAATQQQQAQQALLMKEAEEKMKKEMQKKPPRRRRGEA